MMREGTEPKRRLRFGYTAGLPGGVRAAWGARWIAPADQLHDRTDLVGDAEEANALLAWLDDGAWRAARTEARELFRTGQLAGDSRDGVVLYEDRHGIVKGSPNGSYGYFYECAYLFAHVAAAS